MLGVVVKGELNPESNMAWNYSIYWINFSGVNESDKKIQI